MGKKVELSAAEKRELLWLRCGGRCEVSGLSLGVSSFDVHHRRPRGMGGSSRWDTELLSNLLAVRPEVHSGGPLSVHGVRRGWMVDRGFLVPQGFVAGVWPLWLFGECWVLLLPSGGYRLLPWVDRPLVG